MSKLEGKTVERIWGSKCGVTLPWYAWEGKCDDQLPSGEGKCDNSLSLVNTLRG